MLKVTQAIVLTSFFYLISCGSLEIEKGVLIQGYDVVTLSGMNIPLKAKVEHDQLFPYRPDISGEKINFINLSSKVTSTAVSLNGHVYYKNPPLKQGTHKFQLSRAKDSCSTCKKNLITVAVLDKLNKIIIVDIDHTLADTNYIDFFKDDISLIKPLTNAIKITNMLKKDYYFIYVTARDDSFINKTKRWMAHWNFPLGPIYFKDISNAESRKEYKSRTIANLKNSLKNVLIGIGDKLHDIRAYRENGLRAYYIGKPVKRLPSETVRVKSWKQIYNHLKKNPIGTLEKDPHIY